MDKVDVRFPTERKPVNLPRNAEERAVALVDLCARLAQQMDRETAAVRDHRPAEEVMALANGKHPLCIAYEELSRLLRIDRAGMAALAPDLKERLAAATQTLSESARANVHALKLAGETQQTLVDMMVHAMNQLRQTAPGVAYGPRQSNGPLLRGYGAPTRGPQTSATLNACL
ncbi:flagellar basal-body protein [Azospirillum sp.]|uniref:flagellar basal-body protein n=1 Tax=Azospirillum sp. TaxID=34012 RepID=UPI003D7232B2